MSNDRKTGRGQLNYEAYFYPTLALAKEATEKEEQAKENEKEAAQEETTTETTVSEKLPPATDLHGEPIIYAEDKKHINLMAYPSGVLSVKIHQVDLPNKERAVVEILLDSNDAQFRTSDVKGTTLTFQESGDAFVKEMDFSRLVVRVREAKNHHENERIGFWTSPVQDIVSKLQTEDAEEDHVQEFKLLDCAGGSIRLSFKFIPVVQFKLDPSESLESKFFVG